MQLITSYLHVIHGNDETAALADRMRPFKTHPAAMRALMPFIADATNCTRLLDVSGDPAPAQPA